MKRHMVNWLLVPVLTVGIACSVTRVDITVAHLGQQMSAGCPFQMDMPKQGPAEVPTKSACTNCLSSSILLEQPHQVASPLELSAVLPLELVSGTIVLPASHLANPALPLDDVAPPHPSLFSLRI
jgi:hypothetical protein